MTREETIKILMMIQAAYPNYKPQDKTVTVNTWLMMLQDYPYSQVEGAFKAYVASETKGFAPSVGQIIDKMQMISGPQELTEMEAWTLVSRAIRNSGYNSVEEFAKLPPLVQKVVGDHGQLRLWGLDEDYNEQVASSNFMRTYRTVLAREKEIGKMPSDVKALIDRANQNSPSARIEQRRADAIAQADSQKIESNDNETIPMPNWVREKMNELRGSGQRSDTDA